MAHELGFLSEGFADTQPMDSQIYKDYTTSMLHTEEAAAPGTYKDGDTGHVDLIGDWDQEVQRERASSFIEEEINGVSPATQLRVQPTSDCITNPPETPAIIGQKHTYHGEIVSSIGKTPASAVAAIFGNGGNAAISLTQAFNATQAPSSPLPGALRSDPVSERPSPNFQTVRLSSPQMIGSSPTKLSRSDQSMRSGLEPRNSYQTMKESQELRERRKKQQEELSLLKAKIQEDDFENEIIAEERKAELQRRQEQLDKLSSKIIDSDALFTTPATTRPRHTRDAFEISDFINEEDEELSEASQPGDKVGTQSPNKAVAEEQTEEGGVQVPMTSSRPKLDQTEWRLSQAGPSVIDHEQLQQAAASSPINTGLNSLQDLLDKQTHPLDAASQTVAVADSQPENHAALDIIEPSSALSISRAPNMRLANSVYARMSSQTRELLGSSMPKVPPSSSSQPGDGPDARIPSSPPIAMTVQEPHLDEDEENTSEDEGLIAVKVDTRGGPRKGTKFTQKPITTSQDSREENADKKRLAGSVSGKSAVQQRGSDSGKTETHGTSHFETAHTHITGSSDKSRLPSQSSGVTNPSPSKITRSTRKLTDIAADPSIEKSSIDAEVDFELLTEQDKEFNAMMSGSSPVRPSRKRRKVYSGRALRLPTREPLDSSSPVTSPLPQSSTADEPVTDTTSPRDQEDPVYSLPAALKTGALKRPTQSVKIVHKTPAKTVMLPPQSAPPRKRTLEVAETPQAKLYVPAESENTKADYQRIRVEQAQDNHSKAPSISVPVQKDGPVKLVHPEPVILPQRVLALFKGSKRAFYPATFLGPGKSDGSTLKIRFDDGTVDSNLDISNIRTLSLRIGDLVKVDLSNMRTKTYTVCGFKDKVTTAKEQEKDGSFPLTDIHGFETVILAVKPRDSLPDPVSTIDDETVDVPVTNIYITHTMWGRFNDRLFTLDHKSSTDSASGRSPTLQNALEGSLPRRALGQALGVREESVTSSRQGSDLFATMAFTLSFADEKERDKATKLLLDHGGNLLPLGFDCLFQLPMSSGVSSPVKTPRKTKAGSEDHIQLEDYADFTPTSAAASLGFVALLTDTHSRRAKYMQALALGLPCLHNRWLFDCVAQQRILPFSPYLLPAGESTFLGGAVRSRVLVPYNASTARFSEIIEARERLLDEHNIILVMGKGKAEERRRPYVFLTYALGASRVVRVPNLDAAKKTLEVAEAKWDWVYVDGKVEEAEKLLFGNQSSTQVGKKRKRADEDGLDGVTGQRPRVVSDEFVIQSLILGALVD